MKNPNNNKTQKFDVFISHTSEDDSFVSILRDALEKNDLTVWDDSHNLVAGDILTSEIYAGIKSSDCIIVIFSDKTINSEWVINEINYSKNLNKRIIPLLTCGIKPNALKLWFDEEIVALNINNGKDSIEEIMPKLINSIKKNNNNTCYSYDNENLNDSIDFFEKHFDKPIRIPFLVQEFSRSALKYNNIDQWVGREKLIDQIVRGLLFSDNARYLITGYSGVGTTSFVSRVIAGWRKISIHKGFKNILIFNFKYYSNTDKLVGKIYIEKLEEHLQQYQRPIEFKLKQELNIDEEIEKYLLKLNQNINLLKDKSRLLCVLDKISELRVLEKLTSLFEMKKISFIVLGNVNLKEEIENERKKGTHFIDKFQDEYLPGYWNNSKKILARLVSEQYMNSTYGNLFKHIADYLNFISQGLPRKIIQGIDNFTKMIDDNFCIELSEKDIRIIQLSSKLHNVLWQNRKELVGRFIDSVKYHKRDKALRVMYHLTERIFRTSMFTYEEVTTFATQMENHVILESRSKILKNLIEFFEREGFINKISGGYILSDEILKIIEYIPDWLEDSVFDFVSVEKYLNDFNENSDLPPENTGFVNIDHGNTIYADDSESNSKLNSSTYSIDAESTKYSTDLSKEEKNKKAKVKNLENSFKRNNTLSFSPGNVIDKRYKILSILGKGGMSTVYKVEDIVLCEIVALKLLDPLLMKNKEIQKRFINEVKINLIFNHPNIVRVYDIKTIFETLYLTMQYIDGIELRKWMRFNSDPDFEKVLSILRRCCDALSYIHKKGMFHRDIKPSNIMITNDEQLYLLDFGIAKLADGFGELTFAGGAGTPKYMAPEQNRGEGKMDYRVDIYSLGVMTFELLTGELPLFKKPSQLNAKLNSNIDKVIFKALATNPNERYEDIAIFYRDLENSLKDIVT